MLDLQIRPPRHREGIWLDQTVGRSAPIQAARYEKVNAVFGLHVIAYDLIRLGNLLRPVMAAA
jgi:hypothetical protein